MSEKRNYDEEGKEILERLNLDPSTKSQGGNNSVDAIWRNPQTGGRIYVGNRHAAADLRDLRYSSNLDIHWKIFCWVDKVILFYLHVYLVRRESLMWSTALMAMGKSLTTTKTL